MFRENILGGRGGRRAACQQALFAVEGGGGKRETTTSPTPVPPGELTLHKTFSANWNKRKKVSKTLIHFKCDVFATVPIVDAKTAFCVLRSLEREKIESFLIIAILVGSHSAEEREARVYKLNLT